MNHRLRMTTAAALFLHPLLGLGCKGIELTEITGKTSFGPEFRNFGNNTADIRYTAIQGVDLKWSNGHTTGISYQRRDLDDGAGDNENLVLFEFGYPLWKAPKKPQTASVQLRELEAELQELNDLLVKAEAGTPTQAFASGKDVTNETTEERNIDDALP